MVDILFIGLCAFTIVAFAPRTRLGSRLAGTVTQAVRGAADATQRDMRVDKLQIKVMTIGIVALGIAMAIALQRPLGWQGVVLGVAVAIAGVLGPARFFKDGWPVWVVKKAQDEMGGLLTSVYLQSGMAGLPVDEAVRLYARFRAESGRGKYGESALSRLIMCCPGDESPIDFLLALDIPGIGIENTLHLLGELRGVPENEREQILAGLVDTALRTLDSDLQALARKKALSGVICGVGILAPALLLGMLLPPVLSFVQRLP